ncbi:MAG: orotidine-5'-phosphate decarboxylase [Zoogloeaceae bacterium]|nr:orotidine-5'-phosphate decarboxylase [Zoogloeaceae bacterium]
MALCQCQPIIEMPYLSSKPIPVSDRLIVALDLPDPGHAQAFVSRLGDAATFYKIGLELFMSPGYFKLLDWLVAQDKKVFVDLKCFDVPETVRSAIRALSQTGATLATIHGNQSIMEAAVQDKGTLKVLAVTALTSLDQGDLRDLGFQCDVPQLVLSRARRALEAGVDGIVSSGLEAPMIREQLGPRLLVVTPGIRPVENKPADDQKRTVDVRQAFSNGADYIVVGRPIRQAPDPREAALAIQHTMADLFAGG